METVDRRLGVPPDARRRSGSRHWSTSSSSAGSSRAMPIGPRPRVAAARRRCRCSCSACGCSRCRRRDRPCSSRSAATAMAVGSAYETFVQRNLEILGEPWFPLVQHDRPTADAVATVGAASVVFATFPDRRPGAPVAADRGRASSGPRCWSGPLALLTTPARRDAAVHRHQRRRRSRTRTPCRGSSGRRPAVQYLVVQPWAAVALGLARALLPCAVRRRPRCARAPASWPGGRRRRWWPSAAGRSSRTSGSSSSLVYAALIAIPVAGDPRHPPLRRVRHRAGRSRRRVARSSNLLITVVYACAGRDARRCCSRDR